MSHQPGGIAKGSLITILGRLAPPLAAFVSGPILAQTLGVGGRGVVSAAAAPLGLVAALMSFGIPEALNFTAARHPALVRAAMRSATLLLVVSGVCGLLVIYLASDFLSGGSDQIRHLILVASLAVIPTLVLGVLRGAASGLQLWTTVALERVLASTLRLGVLLVLWMSGQLNVFTATCVIAMIPLMGSLAYLRIGSRVRLVPQRRSREAQPRALLGYGLRIWVGSFSGIVLLRIDQTLMTPLAGSYQLGLYTVAVTIAEMPLIVNASIRDVIFSVDARRSDDFRLARAARISMLATGIVCLLIGITMWWWLPALFGAGFRDSLPIAAILLLTTVLGTPGSIASAGISARGRPGLRSMTLLVGASVNLVLLLVLAPKFGGVGAAIASLVGYTLSAALSLGVLSHIWHLPIRDFVSIRGEDLHYLKSLVWPRLSRMRSKWRRGPNR